MPLPDITHLQYLVLVALLNNGESTGRTVRAELAKDGVKKSLAAFYQLMARLEDGKLVEGWYEEKMADGHRIKESRYRITGKGETAAHRAYEFYMSNGRGIEVKGGFA